MVLEKLRVGARKVLMPLTKMFAGVSPNVITWFSLLFAILAGFSVYLIHIWPYAFIFAGLFLFLNSLFDLLDGDVARLTGKSSRRGDFLDHTFDRYSDLAIVFGMIMTPHCSVTWGLVAVSGMLLVSYMGTQAQALGVGRIYGGLLGRADRLLIMAIVILGEFVLVMRSTPLSLDWELFGIRVVQNNQFFGAYLYTLAMIYFSFAGHYTAIYRAVKTWQFLGKEEGGKVEKENKEKGGSGKGKGAGKGKRT